MHTMMTVALLLLFMVIIIIIIKLHRRLPVFILCPSVWAAHAFNYALLDDYYYFHVYGDIVFIFITYYTYVFQIMLFAASMQLL